MRQRSSKKNTRKAMSAEERRRAHCKAQSKYRTSERGLFMQREWRRTPKGVNCNWEYQRSFLGRERAFMYEMSDKGRATRAAYIRSGRSRQMAYTRYHSPGGEELRWAKHNKRFVELGKYLSSPAGRNDSYAAEQYRRLLNFINAKAYNLPPSEKSLKARARRERKCQEAVELARAQIKWAQDSLKPRRHRQKGWVTWDEAAKLITFRTELTRDRGLKRRTKLRAARSRCAAGRVSKMVSFSDSQL
jgi:hypothetical protein